MMLQSEEMEEQWRIMSDPNATPEERAEPEEKFAELWKEAHAAFSMFTYRPDDPMQEMS